jgi:hypothetical protein
VFYNVGRSSSDPTKNPEGAILWSRMLANRKLIESDVGKIEQDLLDDPKMVFFGPTIATILRFKSIPCHIEASSGSIYKVGLRGATQVPGMRVRGILLIR